MAIEKDYSLWSFQGKSLEDMTREELMECIETLSRLHSEAQEQHDKDIGVLCGD